jgi:serine/threonine-protein kinase
MVEPISLQPITQDALKLARTRTDTRPGLPVDLLQDIARRLQFVSILVLVISVASLFMQLLTQLDTSPTARWGAEIFIWTTSLAMFFLARSGKLGAARLLDVGLAYEVAVALAVSLLSVEVNWFLSTRYGITWSPVAVWVVLFPVVVPSPIHKTLIAASLAAATEPLMVFVLAGAGIGDVPSVKLFIRQVWPNAVAIAFAVAVSRVVYRLGEQLKRARSMGSYHLGELLGRGGMGEVWKATHQMLARTAAVKLIRPEALGASNPAAAEKALRRFEREAQATAALRSPNTIEVYDFGISRDGTFYYVMELLDGLDMQSMVEKHGVQPPERVAYLLRQACHSLHEAHMTGLIHRDIKPANIFVCRYGIDLDFVKVLDFGIVKQQEPERRPDAQLTEVGAVAGTPAFLAPEMALGEGPVDGRADIYALGCVAYWLLTGQMVFDKPSAMGMIVAHSKETPVSVSARAPQEVPQDFERIVMACLEKNPEDRPKDAGDLARRLGNLDIERLWTSERKEEWWRDHRKP